MIFKIFSTSIKPEFSGTPKDALVCSPNLTWTRKVVGTRTQPKLNPTFATWLHHYNLGITGVGYAPVLGSFSGILWLIKSWNIFKACMGSQSPDRDPDNRKWSNWSWIMKLIKSSVHVVISFPFTYDCFSLALTEISFCFKKWFIERGKFWSDSLLDSLFPSWNPVFV